MYLKNYQILYEKFSSKLKLKSKSLIVTKGLYKKQGRKDLVAKEDFFFTKDTSFTGREGVWWALVVEQRGKKNFSRKILCVLMGGEHWF